MGSLARKDMELRFVMTTDATKATAAMQQLTREAERTGMAVKSIGMGPLGTSGLPGAGAGTGGGALSLVRGVATGASGQLAGAAALISTAAGVHKAFLDLDSGMLTVREKTLNFAKALPVVGDALSSFIGNLMDARDRMLNPDQYRNVQRLREESPIRMAQAGARHEFDQRMGGWNRELADARFSARATREFPTIASGQSLLTGSVGGIAGSFVGAGLGAVDPRFSASLEAIQEARRGHRVAELTAERSAAEVDAAKKKSDRAMREWQGAKADSLASYDAARGGGLSRSDQAGQAAFDRFGFNSNPNAGYLRRFGNELGAVTIGTAARQIGRWNPDQTLDGRDRGSNLSMEEARLREKELEHKANLANAELEQKMSKNKGDQLALAQRSHEIAKAQTRVMRDQLSIIDEQIAKTRSGQQQFGMMDEFQQSDLLVAARKLKEKGREGVTPDEIQALMSNTLTRDLVGQRAERDAESNPRYQALAKLLDIRDKSDQQREREKLKTEIDVKVQFDEEKFGTMVEASLKKMDFQGLFIKLLDVKLRESSLANMEKRANSNQ